MKLKTTQLNLQNKWTIRTNQLSPKQIILCIFIENIYIYIYTWKFKILKANI